MVINLNIRIGMYNVRTESKVVLIKLMDIYRDDNSRRFHVQIKRPAG